MMITILDFSAADFYMMYSTLHTVPRNKLHEEYSSSNVGLNIKGGL